jgi:peptidoglycan-N-acetylglucosamine deacetylase
VTSRTAASLAVASAAGLAAYWRHLSPSSQAVGPFPWRAEDVTGTPTLALTFDDGPHEPYTSEIAALLEERGIRGTFFQVGRCVERHPGLTRDLADRGHVIGNHSHTHRFQKGWTRVRLREEVGAAQEVLTDELGRSPALYRPPWLIRTAATFEVLDELGLRAVSGQFCHPLEPMQPPAAWMVRWADTVVARNGRIVIFHDGYDDKGASRSRTVAALAELLDRWSAQGYAFTTVDRLLGVPAYA